MKLIEQMPYNIVEFVWIENHWDIHLTGICHYKGKLCYFNADRDAYYKLQDIAYALDDDSDDELIDNPMDFLCEIYELNWLERCRWLQRKWLFELCVGYHWTIKAGQRSSFHYRNPKWLYKLLIMIYFKRWKPI